MSLTNTKRFMNWTGVSFTPSGGSAITVTGVTSVQFAPGGSLAKFAGDGDRYNTTVVNDFNDPTFTIQAADLAALNNLPPGTRGAFTATHNDAKNRAVTGSFAITYAMANCVIMDNPVGGLHRQFGQGSLSFCGESSDGLTNPVTLTVL